MTEHGRRARFSTRRAFVVQVGADADLRLGRLEGRVEHVVSGRVRELEGIDEMIRFFAETLAQEDEPMEEESES